MKKLKLLTKTLLCTTFLLPAATAKFENNKNQKKEETLTRSISLDTGYLPSLNSNRAIGEFDLELRQAWGALYDWQQDVWKPCTFLGRSILYSLFSIATWGSTMGQMATYHEIGHATRLGAIGVKTSFINAGKAAWNIYQKGADKIEIDDVLSDSYFPTLFGTMGVSSITGIGWIFSAIFPRYDKPLMFVPKDDHLYYNPKKLSDAGSALKESLKKKKYDPEKDKDTVQLGEKFNVLTPTATVLVMAGGLNNQQDQCRRVENHLWYSGGDHFTLVGAYFWDKTWAGFQSSLSKDKGYADGQDTSSICKAYAQLGIELTHEKIIKYSYLSYVLSAQTYANIYQIYKTIADGESKVYAPEVWNIRLPNVALYFTTKGPTYNVSTGYRYGDTWYFPASIEFGLKQTAWEATLGVRKKFPSFHDSFIHAEVVFNSQAVGGSIYSGAIFDRMWNVQAGVTYHNANTFQGERNIPSYKTGDTDIEAWIKLGVVY